jgi:hypothetical protein
MSYLEGLRETAFSVRRLGLAPLLFRLVVWVSGFVALVYASPYPLLASPLALFVLVGVALVPAVRPDTWLVAALSLLAVFGWLLRTTVLSEPVVWVAVLWLASSLYVHHVSAAFAAALPMSAVVTRGVWLRPLLRVVGVLAVTGLLTLLGSWLSGSVSPAPSVAVPVLGVVLALGLAVLLAVRARGSRT